MGRGDGKSKGVSGPEARGLSRQAQTLKSEDIFTTCGATDAPFLWPPTTFLWPPRVTVTAGFGLMAGYPSPEQRDSEAL
jgi:hypothetical protein